MNRSEFIDELRTALQGEISQAKINENLQYYENYIIEESCKDRTEDEVIEELGNPRLIAKTIIDTTDQPYVSGQNENGQDESDQRYEYNEEGQTRNTNYGHPRGFHINFDEKNGWDIRYGRFKFNSWYGTVVIVLLVLLFFFILANITIVLIPVMVPVFLIGIILYLFFGKRK